MSRAEALSICWDMFLDSHVRIAKAYKLDDVAFFGQNGRLLRSARCAFWAIITRELFASIFHSYSLGKAYHPSGISTLFFDNTARPLESKVHTRALTGSANLSGCPLGT